MFTFINAASCSIWRQNTALSTEHDHHHTAMCCQLL